VWQDESFDHVLPSAEKLEDRIEYVLQNPVRRGLVKNWKDYRWTWSMAVAKAKADELRSPRPARAAGPRKPANLNN